MKFLLTIAASFFITSSLYAQSNLNVISFKGVCTTHLEFAQTLSNYEEVPLARGDSVRPLNNIPSSVLVVFVNPKTKTFTIAERITEEIVCVIAMGQEFEPLDAEGNSLTAPSEKYQGTKLH